MYKLGRFLSDCFDVTRIFPIFAESKLQCGHEAAGIKSSLFCVHEFINKGIATPSWESGNRPTDSALKFRTARSVAIFLSKLQCYVTEELFCAREQNGAAVFLPAPGVKQVPQGYVSRRAGALHVDGTDTGAPQHHGSGVPRSAAHCAGKGGCNQPGVGRHTSVPGNDLRTAAEDRERLHSHRACQQEAPKPAAACHRLSRGGEAVEMPASGLVISQITNLLSL